MQKTCQNITHVKGITVTVCLSLLLLFSQTVFAENQETGFVKVKYIENWTSNEAFYVQTDTNLSSATNPAECSHTGQYFVPDDAAEMIKKMVLTAYLNKTSINFVIHGENCNQSRPIVVATKMLKVDKI
jgi:hypothetical protein